MTDLLDRVKSAVADRYSIQHELGQGGMAVVYLARDLRHERLVALKVLRPELAESLGDERFLREIQIASQLNHPHILSLHDSGEADGVLWYTMPFIEGESLRDRLEREDQLPIDDALQITREVADGLGYAHSLGVVHRDIKPENILLSGGHAVIADFGIARAVTEAGGEKLTQTGIAIGTPAYMSPEQGAGSGKVDARSDLYSLACLLYEMLAGEPPYTGPTVPAIVAKKMSEPTPRISVVREMVPLPIEEALTRALAKTPADRFATAEQFTAALSVDVKAHERWLRRRLRVRRAATAVAAIVSVAAIVTAVLAGRQLMTGWSDPGPPPPDRPYAVLATVGGSADSTMRDAVEFLLRSGLDAAHVIQTMPAREVERLLTLMERPATAPIDPATARELAERYGVSTVVLPRFDALGSSFLVAARVEEVETGHLLAEASRRAEDADAVPATVDAVTMELRRNLGETRAVLANSEPLPEVLTPSLGALREYRMGAALFRTFHPGQAVPYFRAALAIDPEFSSAHVELSAAYHNAGIADSVVVHLRRALETPNRLTDIQRRDTEAYLKYASDFALWDESLFRSGYRNRDALRLTDFQYFDSAQAIMTSEVQEVVRRSRRFDPDGPLSTEDNNRWRNAIRLAIVTGWVEELEAFVDSLRVDTGEYWELMRSFDSSDWDRADSVRRSAPDIWGTHVNKRMAVTALDVARGRIRESFDSWASIPSRRVSSARVQLMFEVVYGVPGTDTLVSLTDRGLTAVETYVVHGVRSAVLGDTADAKRVAARMEAARDSATSDLFERAFQPMFALLQAGIAMRRDDWLEASRLLEPCADRLAERGYGFSTDRFLVRWVLAEAYARLGRTDASIQQYDALLSERSFEPLYVLMFAPAHFRLARLYAEMSNTSEAIEHYRIFLGTFTDPDPEYEWMVADARAELARLGG